MPFLCYRGESDMANHYRTFVAIQTPMAIDPRRPRGSSTTVGLTWLCPAQTCATPAALTSRLAGSTSSSQTRRTTLPVACRSNRRGLKLRQKHDDVPAVAAGRAILTRLTRVPHRAIDSRVSSAISTEAIAASILAIARRRLRRTGHTIAPWAAGTTIGSNLGSFDRSSGNQD